MDRIPIRDHGLVGTLFRRGRPTKAVLLLGGASGGFREEWALQLAEEGFAALSLAYFAAESLPPQLSRIPLEYFENAIEFLRHDVEKVGCCGVSRGGELSLILGSLFAKRINAIAAHVPSSVVYGALDVHPTIPAWLYKGKPFAPSAPFQYKEIASGESEGSAIFTTPFFLDGMQDRSAYSASAIPVEKIECPLLIISAEDDQMWPSSVFAEQIVSRLDAYQSPIYRQHLSYPKVGHSPSKGSTGFHPIMKRWFAFGGDLVENAIATKDWWNQTIQFFKEQL